VTILSRVIQTDEVMQRGAEHAMKVHGMKEDEITPEFKEKVRGLIRTS
jgi:predicted small metal-binding protein